MKHLFSFTLLIFILSNCSSTSKNPFPKGEVMKLTDTNFKESVLENKELSVVYFWAEWCGPCRMTGPVLDELARDHEGKTGFGKIDVDVNPEITMQYGIRSIPTVLIIKKGEVVEKHVGVFTKQIMKNKIKEHS